MKLLCPSSIKGDPVLNSSRNILICLEILTVKAHVPIVKCILTGPDLVSDCADES